MSGWIRLDRAILENPIWSSKSESFTKGQAWVDILLNANYKPNFFFVRGIKISLKRGQLGWSQLTMAGRWGWSRKKVNRFLKTLEEEQMVTLQTTQQTTVITICNYCKYQDSEPEGVQQKGQQKSNRGYDRGTTEGTTDDPQLNKQTNKQGNKRRGFTPPTRDEAHAFFAEKGCVAEADCFMDHYLSNGWMVGKSKMKDWRAAGRNWLKNTNFRSNRDTKVVEIDPRKAAAKQKVSDELRELMRGIGDVD